MLNKISNKLQNKPKSLFLIDGLGALVSMIFLGFVLVKFEQYFGIPKPTLYLLATFPCLFLLFDIYGYFFIIINIGRQLRIISILNFSYVILSLILTFKKIDEIALFGWLYFFFEILTILILATIEYKVGRNIKI